MKIFSLGFLLGSVRIWYLNDWHLNSIKVFFDNIIVIIPGYLITIFITWNCILSIYKYVNYKFIITFYKHFKGNKSVHSILNKYFKVKKKVFNSKLKNEKPWQCLLIDGAWGSGKTTYYENNYQYIDNNPNIYISCFSASRSELIAQIIQQQFWCKLLTLNGLLAKFMENNWQIFMPKNRVVVFDDLERLHANQDNYLDLIGMIDYLKDKKKCQIILICNISELKEPIFNTYMERVVDEVEFPTLMSENEFENSLIKNASKLTKGLLARLYNFYEHGEVNNLRIIKNIMPKIAKKLESDYSEFDEVKPVLNGSQYEINVLINKHYLFYTDNALFKECVEFNNGKKLLTDQGSKDEIILDLQKKVKKYFLSHTNFRCLDYKTWRDIGEILQPNFKDFLRLDIEANLELDDYVIHDDRVRIQNLVIQYLEKYINHKTKNDFENGDYALLLLYVLYHAKYEGYDELFEFVLTSKEFINPSSYTPLKSDTNLLFNFSHASNDAVFKKLFEIKEFNEEGFLTKYFDFYRKKIIDKFISLTNGIDHESLEHFSDDWFKNEHSSVNYNIIDEMTKISALDSLYNLTNKCLNLYIINKWIDQGVNQSILTQYYIGIIGKFQGLRKDKSKAYMNPKIDQLASLICDVEINSSQIELLTEKNGSFDKMRDRLFHFKNIVAEYIKSNEAELQKFTKYNNDNLEIIGKLFVEKTTEDN